MKNEKRSSFTGKLGFVLAAAGSAVGLGNLWRFPYLAAKYGGGIFLLVYIVLAFTFGFTLMMGEIALGRKTGLSAIGAFSKLNKKFAFVGWLAALIPAIILPYYSVIGGWVLHYFTTFLTPSGAESAAVGKEYFFGFVGTVSTPIICFCIYLAATAIIVLLGVEKGIEKASKIMMPLLIVLSIFIAGYVVTRPGSMEGVIYYLKPDFSKFSVNTVLAAMGQLFYSMSLAMGIMITYGSYMKKDVSINSAVKQIEYFDTGIALVAGLMVIPAVFSFSGGSPETLGAGPGLMFIALPQVFADMPGGNIIGIVFFMLVLFAALTSSISLMETVVSVLCDKFRIKRITSCICVLIFSLLLGLVSCFGFNIWSSIKPLGLDDLLTFFDFITNSVMMPITALFTSIFIGYVIKPKTITDEVELTGPFGRKKLFSFIIKYVAPIFIILILVSSVLDAFKIIKL